MAALGNALAGDDVRDYVSAGALEDAREAAHAAGDLRDGRGGPLNGGRTR